MIISLIMALALQSIPTHADGAMDSADEMAANMAMGNAEMNYVSPSTCDSAYGWTDDVTADQQKVINQILGDRNHRMEHALWHASRSGFGTDTDEVGKYYGAG